MIRRPPVPVRRRGFTLIELLVVMAIIGLLIAMLMPAIQNARETQRKMECNNNLHQIVLAMHIYADSKGCFPSGVIDDQANPRTGRTTTFNPPYRVPINGGQQLYSLPNFAVSQWWGWHALLLNDLGFQTIPVAFVYDSNGDRFTIASEVTAMRTTIKTYTCPTATVSPNSERFAYTNYRGSCGSTMDGNGNPNTDSAGNFFCDGGVFYPHSTTSYRDLEHDGAANIIMVGETLFGFWGDGYTCCAGERHDKNSVFDFQPDPWGFGSWHKDIVNVAFGDGRATGLKKNIDRITFRRLCIRNDGQNPGEY